ncbi:unnamed protein product [Lupinus luteus]|uniref:Uncharacterized protein n=1 Tax=Lupinus luteus TaxID=3873 RepID=A0AAV1W9D9_LUPLU
MGHLIWIYCIYGKVLEIRENYRSFSEEARDFNIFTFYAPILILPPSFPPVTAAVAESEILQLSFAAVAGKELVPVRFSLALHKP